MRRTTWTAAAAAGLLALTACGGGQGAGPQQAETGESTGEYDGPASAPVLALYLLSQPFIIEGVSRSGLKG
jgi:hypothetical protein